MKHFVSWVLLVAVAMCCLVAAGFVAHGAWQLVCLGWRLAE